MGHSHRKSSGDRFKHDRRKDRSPVAKSSRPLSGEEYTRTKGKIEWPEGNSPRAVSQGVSEGYAAQPPAGGRQAHYDKVK